MRVEPGAVGEAKLARAPGSLNLEDQRPVGKHQPFERRPALARHLHQARADGRRRDDLHHRGDRPERGARAGCRERVLPAVRWNLLAWEDPHCPSHASPFWADAPAVDAVVVPAGDADGHALRHVARRTGARFQGLRLRDGTLFVKFVRGRRTALFRVFDGDAFDPARSGLEIAARTDGHARGGRGRLEKLDRVLFGR